MFVQAYFPLGPKVQSTIITQVGSATPDKPFQAWGYMLGKDGTQYRPDGIAPNRQVDLLFQGFSPKGFGSMHGKIIVLRAKDFLRVCFTSSNMTGQWTMIREVVWAQDFPVLCKQNDLRYDEPSYSSAESSSDDDDETRPDSHLPRLYSSTDAGRDFAHQLISYLAQLRIPLPRIKKLLDRVDFSMARAAIVVSVPLTTSDPAVQRTVGQGRLCDLLSRYSWPTAHGREPINCIAGSIGFLKPYFMVRLARSLTGNMKHPLARSNRNTFISKHSPWYNTDSTAFRGFASYCPRFQIMFPTEPRAMVSTMGYPDSVNVHKSFYHDPKFPRELFVDGVANPVYGAGIEVKEDWMRIKEPLCHAKVIYRAADYQGAAPDGYTAGWLYAGSHNLSENAWGKFPADKDGEWRWLSKTQPPKGRNSESASAVAAAANGGSSAESGTNTGRRSRGSKDRFQTFSFETGVLMIASSSEQFESWKRAVPLIPGKPYTFQTIPYTFGGTLQGGNKKGVSTFMERRREWFAKRNLLGEFPELDFNAYVSVEDGEEVDEEHAKREEEANMLEAAAMVAAIEASLEEQGIHSDDEEDPELAAELGLPYESAIESAIGDSSKKRRRGDEEEEQLLEAALAKSMMD